MSLDHQSLFYASSKHKTFCFLGVDTKLVDKVRLNNCLIYIW
jgi:hypothetical protein